MHPHAHINHPPTNSQIAIVEPNTLARFGLQSILEELIPMAVIRGFGSFEELEEAGANSFAHYFIASQIYFEHTAFFMTLRPKPIVLSNGTGSPQLAGMITLNVAQGEKAMMREIMSLHGHGHQHHNPEGGRPHPHLMRQKPAQTQLSAREIEVMVLIVKGFINKEIADKLNISLTTVITHRKNIMEKLEVKSVSALTVYAVMHGYVEVENV